MKKTSLLLTTTVLTLATNFSNAQGNDMETQNSIHMTATPVILTDGQHKINAVIYDNKTGRDVLSQLPYTITLHRYEMDYCGTLDSPLNFDEKDKHAGWNNGDIDLAGNYFSILFDGEEKSQSYKDMITFGRIDEDLDIIKNLGSTVSLTITMAE